MSGLFAQDLCKKRNMIVGNIRLSLRGYKVQQCKLPPSPIREYFCKIPHTISNPSRIDEHEFTKWGNSIGIIQSDQQGEGDAYKSNTAGGVGRLGLTTLANRE